MTKEPSRFRHHRWTICALLFFATTINYIDRQILGILAPELEKEIGWSETQYGDIVSSFQLAYAIGLVGMGRVMDWLGTRMGFSLAIVFWSIAAMAHAAARTTGGFALARFALGLGEAGNFPAAIKTVAEWFPRKERALATGIFNSGSNIGAVIGPLLVPWLARNYGWQMAFIVTGAIGFVWLGFWLWLYRPPREHRWVTPQELAHIESDPAEPTERVRWLELLRHRETWAFSLGKFMTDPIWWFYLFWLPKFFKANHGISLEGIGAPLVTIYLAADVGSIGGGWISSALLKRGWTVNAARKLALFICALSVVPIMFATQVSSLWAAVALISLAAAAHQGWSANLFTLTSDLFPKRAVGSVVGIGGMAGALGGMLLASSAGRLLDALGSYVPLFLIAGLAYLSALLVIHLLSPTLQPARLSTGSAKE